MRSQNVSSPLKLSYLKTKIVKIWLILNAVDLITTFLAIQCGAVEGNPIMRRSGVASIDAIAIWKVTGALLAVGLLGSVGRLHWLRLPSIGMAIVCIWNLLILSLVNGFLA